MKTKNTLIVMCSVCASLAMSNAWASRYGPLGEMLDDGVSIVNDFNRAARNPYDVSGSGWRSGQVTDDFNRAAKPPEDFSSPTPRLVPDGTPPANTPKF